MWSEAIFVGGGRKCAGKFWNCWPRWVGCLLENGDECGSEHTIPWRHQPGSPQLTRSSKPVRTHPVPTVTRVITRSSAKKEPPEIPWWVGLVRIYCAKLRQWEPAGSVHRSTTSKFVTPTAPSCIDNSWRSTTLPAVNSKVVLQLLSIHHKAVGVKNYVLTEGRFKQAVSASLMVGGNQSVQPHWC